MGFIFPHNTPTSFLNFLRRELTGQLESVAPPPDIPQGTGPSRDRLRQAIDEAKCRFGETLDKLAAEQSGPVEPKDLLELETRLHQEVAQLCLDPVVGALVQDAHDDEEIQIKASVLQLNRPHLQLQKSDQEVTITLLGGSQVKVNTPYYLRRPPRGRGRPRTKKGRKKSNGNGLYPVLAVLGMHLRTTPALASEVARLVAVGTVDQAKDTLARRGIRLDRKIITRVALSLAQSGLSYRSWVEQRTQDGARGQSVKGKRLVIGGDGGRVRIRYAKKKGRRRKSGRKGFDGLWREPKVLVVYEVDERGRKVKKKGFCRYDATMQDADGFFAILTALLREIGAHEAKEWIVVGDGADWIWDRVPALIEAVGFDSKKVTQVVDYYHATQRLNEIAAERKDWSASDRKKWVERMTGLLWKDRVEEVVAQRSELFKGRGAKKRRKLFNYFVDRADKMRYGTFRKKGIPLGSGAVESCVRRLINLRLKGNGIFWKLENAEAILHLRAQLLCGRWDDFVNTILRPQDVWTLDAQNPYETNREAALNVVRKRNRRIENSKAKKAAKAA